MSRRSLTSVHTKFGKHGTTGDFSWVRLGQCFVVLCSSLVLLGLVSGETTNRTVCLLTCTHGKNETIAYSACIEKDRETPAVNVSLSLSLSLSLFSLVTVLVTWWEGGVHGKKRRGKHATLIGPSWTIVFALFVMLSVKLVSKSCPRLY